MIVRIFGLWKKLDNAQMLILVPEGQPSQDGAALHITLVPPPILVRPVQSHATVLHCHSHCHCHCHATATGGFEHLQCS